MKKILTTLVLICGFVAAKAQTPHIEISYDLNGNRILRQYAAAKPAPESTDSTGNAADTAIASNDTAAGNGLTAAVKPGFKVYPNPSDNNFNIAVDAAMLQNNCEIALTDQLGKTYFRKVLTQSVTTISTQQLADGAYYIIVNNGTQRSSVKIVKKSN